MSTSNERTPAVQKLAALIDRAGLRAPASIALEALQPLDFLSSQVALFVQPFSRGQSWERYTAALTSEAGWGELRHSLRLAPDEQDISGEDNETHPRA